MIQYVLIVGQSRSLQFGFVKRAWPGIEPGTSSKLGSQALRRNHTTRPPGHEELWKKFLYTQNFYFRSARYHVDALLTSSYCYCLPPTYTLCCALAPFKVLPPLWRQSPRLTYWTKCSPASEAKAGRQD